MRVAERAREHRALVRARERSTVGGFDSRPSNWPRYYIRYYARARPYPPVRKIQLYIYSVYVRRVRRLFGRARTPETYENFESHVSQSTRRRLRLRRKPCNLCIPSLFRSRRVAKLRSSRRRRVESENLRSRSFSKGESGIYTVDPRGARSSGRELSERVLKFRSRPFRDLLLSSRNPRNFCRNVETRARAPAHANRYVRCELRRASRRVASPSPPALSPLFLIEAVCVRVRGSGSAKFAR